MATRGKSRQDIVKNEKYADDAMNSIFSNLHKAAKKKRDYIWSTSKFSSLDSIWGDDIEPKTNKIYDDVNARKDSKSKCKIQQDATSVNPVTYASKIHGNVPSERTMKSDFKMEWKITESECERNRTNHLSGENHLVDNVTMIENHTRKLLFETEQISLNLNAGKNISDVKASTVKHDISNPTSSISKMPESERSIENVEKGSEIYWRNHDRKEGTSVRSATSVNISSQGKETDFNIQHVSVNSSSVEKQKAVKSDVEHESYRYTITGKESKIYHARKDVIPGEINSNYAKKITTDNSKKEFQEKSSRHEVKFLNKEQKVERSFQIKRTRHNSGSSIKSSLPSQKRLFWSTQQINVEHDSPTSRSMLKTKLSIKIIKDKQCPEFIVDLSDFQRIKKKFPKLQEILPNIDASEKEIGYSADAMKAVFMFLFNSSYNFDAIPEGTTAVEILAAAKSLEISQFRSKFQAMLLTKLTKENFKLIYPVAVYYDLREICDAYKALFKDSWTLCDDNLYRQRKCFVSVSTYVEPRELLIPLQTADQVLGDNFDKDVSNDIIFEAIEGSYVISGFYIHLNMDNESLNAKNLDLFYSVENLTESIVKEELKVRKPIRSIIVVHFKRKLVVNEKQKIKITVETFIMPYLCFATQEDSITKKTEEGEIMINLTSTYKVQNSNEKRFLIEKLLYYPKTGEST